MSDQNLQLLPDYEQRIAVLKDLGFIDQESRVELKGKVACEVGSTTLRAYLTIADIRLDSFRGRTCPYRAHTRERVSRL